MNLKHCESILEFSHVILLRFCEKRRFNLKVFDFCDFDIHDILSGKSYMTVCT